ncbi:putative membrane protein [Escherichia coli DEC4C]|nr:putative membrane protein [Escherichia coli DEC4C]
MLCHKSVVSCFSQTIIVIPLFPAAHGAVFFYDQPLADGHPVI